MFKCTFGIVMFGVIPVSTDLKLSYEHDRVIPGVDNREPAGNEGEP
jgi:hypothetical protein